MADINTPQADAAVRRGAEAMQQGGRASADALRQNAEVGADVARRANEAGAENIRRGAEFANDTARRGAQAVVESQRQIVQDAARRFEEVSRKVAEAAQGTSENVRQLMALPNAAQGGLRDLQQGVTGLVEGVVQTNLRAAQELFRLANPAPDWRSRCEWGPAAGASSPGGLFARSDPVAGAGAGPPRSPGSCAKVSLGWCFDFRRAHQQHATNYADLI